MGGGGGGVNALRCGGGGGGGGDDDARDATSRSRAAASRRPVSVVMRVPCYVPRSVILGRAVLCLCPTSIRDQTISVSQQACFVPYFDP